MEEIVKLIKVYGTTERVRLFSNRDVGNRYLFSNKSRNRRDMFFFGLVCYKHSINIIRVV